MGKAKLANKGKKAIKKIHNPLKAKKQEAKQKKGEKMFKEFKDYEANKETQKAHSSMYLSYNTALGPPYRVLMDTNFLNFSAQKRIDIIHEMMDCLLAKAVPYVCSCVLAELERLGHKFKVALSLAKDPRFEKLTCDHTYADACIMERIKQHRIYIVATNDKELKRQVRLVPGIPIMYHAGKHFKIERLPDAYGMK